MLVNTRKHQADFKVTGDDQMDALIEQLAFGAELVVLDVFRLLHDSEENDNTEVAKVLAKVSRKRNQRIQQSHGSSQRVLRKKSGSDSRIRKARMFHRNLTDSSSAGCLSKPPALFSPKSRACCRAFQSGNQLRLFGYEVSIGAAEITGKEPLTLGTLLLQFFTGCCHRHQSRPFTLDSNTYKVCLDCGRVVKYSLEQMASSGVWKRSPLKDGGSPCSFKW